MPKIDYQRLVGTTAGQWTILSLAPGAKKRFAVRCACGAESVVDAHSVYSGRSSRCLACASAVRGPQHSHGATRGRTMSPEYQSWRGMLERCSNPNHASFARYGGRGITVCQRWRESFEAFLSDMGPRPTRQHSIERKKNFLGYEPGNCVWATRLEQSLNKETTRRITVGNETLTLIEWARRSGLSPSTIHWRLAHGWDPERAVAGRGGRAA